ncbi:MAG: elongation factor P maturation arginine rhamnosyltransferase EarP [Burkholderiaceae bacterium]|nr:elongation factor P maturation arginine rhamnosyltransferase EarP [Burkholderiaceae bacterium]
MRADVFCRVIDNFGDIGVTWRLARQLTAECGWDVRLWVDDLAVFGKIEPRLQPDAAIQTVCGLRIVRWNQSREIADVEPAGLVIAMFSCEPDTAYRRRMRETSSVLINVEYLSAESWVEGCHTLPALRADGIPAHYFFPGFNPRTGGLPREAALEHDRLAWLGDRPGQRALMHRAGVSAQGIDVWGSAQGARLVSLFCYPHAPVDALLDALVALGTPTLLLVPEGIAPELGSQSRGALRIERIAFLTQPDYDRLLWMADLNFVRGEDSIVRAIWAGKPAVWHIYPQTDDAHLAKLRAWLSIANLPEPAETAILAWNGHPDAIHTVQTAFNDSLSPSMIGDWTAATALFLREQQKIPDLAHSLDRFCRGKLTAAGR